MGGRLLRGPPAPDPEFPEDSGLDLSQIDYLAVPPAEVRSHFERFGCEHGIELVEGLFDETLPSLRERRWAVVRLDGDTYEATWVGLESLYPGLSAGGYLIVDDYVLIEECRRAVDEFRSQHGITEPIEKVDWNGIRWRRESEPVPTAIGEGPFAARGESEAPHRRQSAGAASDPHPARARARARAGDLRERLGASEDELERVRSSAASPADRSMTDSPTEQPHRYFFLHVPKTAGSALQQRLANHFGEAAVYPAKGLDGTDPLTLAVSIGHLRERLAARGDQIRVIAGHFPLCTTELIGGRFTTLTLLREPVERMLSQLRYTRKVNRAARDVPLEELYDDPIRFDAVLHNQMTKMLSLRSTEVADAAMLTRVEFDRDRLERAKEALAGIDVIGLQEQFEDFCEELSARFGWRLGDPETVNATTPAEVPESFRARIAEDNAFDVELYEFANELLHDAGRPRPGKVPLASAHREEP